MSSLKKKMFRFSVQFSVSSSFFDVELYEFYIFGILTPYQRFICKYLLPFTRLLLISLPNESKRSVSLQNERLESVPLIQSLIQDGLPAVSHLEPCGSCDGQTLLEVLGSRNIGRDGTLLFVDSATLLLVTC